MTRIFLVLVAALIAYELVAIANGAPGDTISEIVWAASKDGPLLPFALGFLAGHFFWQRRGSN